MTLTSSAPMVTPCLGDDVAKEVLQWIGAFRQLTKATIISYNMQDYDFWGSGRLSSLLLRQLANGAEIVVMTTPPPGDGSGTAFKEKFSLLEELQRNGAEVYLHERLHAKAYLFLDNSNSMMLIVGSANLTSSGFGRGGGTTTDGLLELALLTGDPQIYSSTLQVIGTKLFRDLDTMDFQAWVRLNRSKVAQAKGAP